MSEPRDLSGAWNPDEHDAECEILSGAVGHDGIYCHCADRRSSKGASEYDEAQAYYDEMGISFPPDEKSKVACGSLYPGGHGEERECVLPHDHSGPHSYSDRPVPIESLLDEDDLAIIAEDANPCLARSDGEDHQRERGARRNN